MSESSSAAPADGQPDWRNHARRLAQALAGHRTDMHQTSKRPCATCRFSKIVLDEYIAASKQDAAGPRGEGA